MGVSSIITDMKLKYMEREWFRRCYSSTFEVFRFDWLVVAIDPIEQKEFVIVNIKKEN